MMNESRNGGDSPFRSGLTRNEKNRPRRSVGMVRLVML